MKCCSLFRRIFWAAVIILLWTWEWQIWCNRTRRVFSSAPNAFWKKVELPTDCELAIPMVSTRGLHLGMEKVETDRYSQALLNAASDSRNAHMTLSCDITVVVDLFKQRGCGDISRVIRAGDLPVRMEGTALNVGC